ncbi:hypothetical protein IU450_13300 [Nocardia abscessus]|uniref:hypothetical protein n=1 Tax=Nocardia abscessus TaxID=120957 RepID=UPI0018946B95|nr:hypothetical protein [Nocardia abscessus]MBF6336857.1 hypothetical protein [Nocardia abscessus]
MTIEVQIDRLVLDDSVRHGISGSSTAAVREAVRAELALLLAATPAATWRAGARRRITVRSTETAADAVGWGGVIARSVCAGLLGGERSGR